MYSTDFGGPKFSSDITTGFTVLIIRDEWVYHYLYLNLVNQLNDPDTYSEGGGDLNR